MAKEKSPKSISTGCGCLIILVAGIGIVAYMNSRSSDPTRTPKPTAKQGTGSPAKKKSSPAGKKPETPPSHEVAEPPKKPETPPSHEVAETPKKPQLSVEQGKYVILAAFYNEAVQDQSCEPPILDVKNPKSSIGRLFGNYEVLQVISRNSALADRIDSDGFSLYPVYVEGISMERITQGHKFSFKDDTIFVYEGTRSYTTVLGATRTVHAVRTIDKDLFEWARDYLKKGKENALLGELAGAKAKVDVLRAELQTLEKANEDLAAYEETTARIRLYEPNAKNNERITALLEKEKKKLESLRTFTHEEVRVYKDKRADLQKKIQAAYKDLRSIRM